MLKLNDRFNRDHVPDVHNTLLLDIDCIPDNVRATAKNYSMGQFRYTVWDPWTIVSQILTLQAIFYLFLGLWIAVFCLMSDSPRSLDQIFSYTELNPNKVGGKLLIAAFFFNALNWYELKKKSLIITVQ